MYEIINTSTGKRLQLCEQPTYILWNEQGNCYAITDAENATGVCVDGVPYAMLEKSLQGTFDAVLVNPIDVGQTISIDQKNITANSAAIDDIIISILEV